MAETPAAQVWSGRLTFLGLAAVILFAQLIPLDEIPSRWTGPDALLVLTLVFLVRRPDFVPFPMILAVFLLADLLLQRPPGLYAACVCLLSEFLRKRARGLRAVPLAVEWGTVAIGVVALTMGYRIVLLFAMVPQSPLMLTIIQAGATILVYPLAAGLAHLFFGLTRPAPGQVDSFGHRL